MFHEYFETHLWALILFVVGLPFTFLIPFFWFMGRMRLRESKKVEDYLSKTEVCPGCFGRGRVPKDGLQFREGTDSFKIKYEQEKAREQARAGVPDSVLKAFKEK